MDIEVAWVCDGLVIKSIISFWEKPLYVVWQHLFDMAKVPAIFSLVVRPVGDIWTGGTFQVVTSLIR